MFKNKNRLILTNACNDIEKLIKWNEMDIYLEDIFNEMFDNIRDSIFYDRYEESVNNIINVIELLKKYNKIENRDIIYIYREILKQI